MRTHTQKRTPPLHPTHTHTHTFFDIASKARSHLKEQHVETHTCFSDGAKQTEEHAAASLQRLIGIIGIQLALHLRLKVTPPPSTTPPPRSRVTASLSALDEPNKCQKRLLVPANIDVPPQKGGAPRHLAPPARGSAQGKGWSAGVKRLRRSREEDSGRSSAEVLEHQPPGVCEALVASTSCVQ